MLSIALLILLNESSIAQQNGTLFLSERLLKQYSYPYETDQFRDEHAIPERFSNNGWKYHSGDDLNWKDPYYNDSDWTISKTDFSFDSLQNNEWTGIGWFRLKLIVDSSLYNKVLALVIMHYGASEIYFDGNLVNQYGTPTNDTLIEKTFRPLFARPILVSVDNKPQHLLAIRYSFLKASNVFRNYRFLIHRIQASLWYGGFTIHFAESQQAVDLFGASLTTNLLVGLITFSILFLMGTFHLFLYWFYAGERSNFYLAMFIFLLALHTFGKFLPTYTHLNLQLLIISEFVHFLLGCFWMPFTMLACYSIFYQKFPRYVWLYFLMCPIIGYAWSFTPPFGGFLVFACSAIVFADMLRLFIRSSRSRQKYIWIIGVGALLSQSTLALWLAPQLLSPLFVTLLLFPIFLGVPIALSIFNALRTAGTSINLERQLVEVKRLSQVSLAQEQEKQEILCSQKETLEQQVQERTAELNQSLQNLKSTQSQLIQSEKMASLGELTAGIAHEIQNPLNFVNNFSEINKELIDELKQERNKVRGTRSVELENEILDNIQANEEKINHHGKRADSIVKGMLQHSRTSTGQKELTDINALCDEYVRLAYHGLRAKDKSFNAKFETDFDDTVGRVNIVPQDMGRVILNLINNAFYAVNEKAKQNIPAYEPCVAVSTRNLNGDVELRVSDNGNGIPQKVVDKIFQPFFTTKPAGQGTGLGLSLAYDIVKAHGGEIKVETKEGERSEFIIQLPTQ